MREISVTELVDVLADGGYVLDVREPDEYAEGHVPGVVPMPMRSVPARTPELPRERPIYLICASGGRSAQVAGFLEQHGYDTVNVAGGTKGWIRAGHDVESGS